MLIRYFKLFSFLKNIVPNLSLKVMREAEVVEADEEAHVMAIALLILVFASANALLIFVAIFFDALVLASIIK